ncbi:cutinase-domain-containing protein [Morchella snyderi]|nr:cutinase-domain-containing protein [Morchella snyderi]
MRLFTTLALLASSTLIAALPAPSDINTDPKALVKSPVYQVYKDVSTRNDLIDGECNDIIVIWARGSSEPGNVGITLGPPFFDAIEEAEPGRTIVQGVNYPAEDSGYFMGGSRTGAEYMASMVSLAASQCPDSLVVLGGYSQGAQVTHLAANHIPEDLYSMIAAIVLFGDPYDGDAFPGSLNDNVATFCNEGDLICDGIPIILPVHLSYDHDVCEAADYIAARV